MPEVHAHAASLLQVGVSNLARLAALFEGEQKGHFSERAQQAVGCFAHRLRTAALALPQLCAALPGLEGAPLHASYLFTLVHGAHSESQVLA